jgi:hypothetical protein
MATVSSAARTRGYSASVRATGVRACAPGGSITVSTGKNRDDSEGSGVSLVLGPPILEVATPLLGAVWEAAANVLTSLQDAPMGIGTAARLLLLMRGAIQSIRGYESLVERARERFATYAEALQDVDKMCGLFPAVSPPVFGITSPTLANTAGEFMVPNSPRHCNLGFVA